MRKCLLVIMSAVALVGAQAVCADAFPNRLIRAITTVPPGSAPDVVARVVSQRMSADLGVPVTVENRTGAGGLIGANAGASAEPDGYTILMADTGVFAILPHLNSGFDPRKSLLPVAPVGMSPIFLAASRGIGVSSVKELLDLAKRKPGLPYGSGGNGTAAHLFMELVTSLASIELVHVPHRGVGPAVQAVVTGDVAFVFAGMNLLGPQAKAGKLKILAVGDTQRSVLFPDVPAIAEELPGFDIRSVTLGFFAPAKTPPEIVDKLNAALTAAIKAPEVEQRLKSLAIELAGDFSAKGLSDTMFRELEQYGRLVNAANVVSK